MLNHLSRAVERKELVVCFQPKVDIKTRKIVGAEALLEWHSPELGKVSPSIFIPIAEQAGLITGIGDYVLKTACDQTKVWHEQGFTPFTIAINLSAFQFKTGDIAEHIANMIWGIQFNPDYLELEITESMIMENVEKSLLMFKVLKTMGIQISLDDFGTGYSSLSQLKKFPIDSLKIDQSFIRPLTTFDKSNVDCAMVNTIIAMAKQLGIKVVAEGVESEAQFQFLKQAGADYAQGYLFSKPVCAEKFVLLLQENL
jgi:EAL domain-containing protein (putative c-di-GMP-specific phosphodiesterase class I)